MFPIVSCAVQTITVYNAKLVIWSILVLVKLVISLVIVEGGSFPSLMEPVPHCVEMAICLEIRNVMMETLMIMMDAPQLAPFSLVMSVVFVMDGRILGSMEPALPSVVTLYSEVTNNAMTATPTIMTAAPPFASQNPAM